jgi:hypothetical protein
MSWPSSIGVGALSAALGLVCAGLIAQACVGWYRVTSFEGRSGYFVVASALAGAAAAFVIGVVVSRFMAAEAPSFLKVLGAALGAVLVAALTVLALCRLLADLAPTIDGRELELEVELRLPAALTLPDPAVSPATASVHIAGGRSQPFGVVRALESVVDGERRVVRVSVPLDTSAADKQLWVRFPPTVDVFFPLPLGAVPQASDREWSAWVAAVRADGVAPDLARRGAPYEARYRVCVVEPAPPAPDPELVREQAFAALAPDAPLSAWLPYLFESPTPERTAVVLRRIDECLGELAELIRSPEPRMRAYALRATIYPKEPAPELIEAVRAEGRAIADGLREANTLAAGDARFDALLSDLSSRFRDWRDAWWGLCLRLPLDGAPLLQEILDVARARSDSSAMRDIAFDAQGIVESLAESAAKEKP